MNLSETIADYDNKVEFLKSTITSIQDYPIKGILFRDITTLCENGKAFKMVTDMFYEIFKDQKIDKVLSSEARGFVFGAPLAERLGAGFVMVRKKGKLPRETIKEEYALEYGTDELHIHTNSVNKGDRVLCIGAGFVMVRKKGKLPRETIKEEYALEYGTDELHIHTNSVNKGDRVLCIDDLLATGGTMIATCKLAQKCGAEVVKAAFVINLVDLGGYDKIKQECGVDCVSLMDFPGH